MEDLGGCQKPSDIQESLGSTGDRWMLIRGSVNMRNSQPSGTPPPSAQRLFSADPLIAALHAPANIVSLKSTVRGKDGCPRKARLFPIYSVPYLRGDVSGKNDRDRSGPLLLWLGQKGMERAGKKRRSWAAGCSIGAFASQLENGRGLVIERATTEGRKARSRWGGPRAGKDLRTHALLRFQGYAARRAEKSSKSTAEFPVLLRFLSWHSRVQH